MSDFPPGVDEDGDDPLDDTADFDVSAAQAKLRRKTETRKQMEPTADIIWAGLAEYARTLSYETVSPKRK